MGGWEARAARVMARCDELAALSDEPGRLTRRFLGDGTRRAHELVRSWLEEAGLRASVDAAGNLRGRREAGAADAGILLLGSHLDTVVDAGRYDGALGVLAAIEVADALADEALGHGLEVVAFSEEEGVRFGVPYLGSRALAGSFDPALLELRDEDGASVREAIRGFGLEPDRIPEAALDPARTLGYVELHIEQGPVLEDAGAALGVPDAIVGQSRLRLRFRGRAAHAGTTPMRLRRDALTGAATFALAVEACALASEELVATVGRFDTAPNAPNVVPGEATLSLDVRHRDDGARRAALADLIGVAERIGDERGLQVEVEALLDAPAAPLDPTLTARLRALAGGPALVSGAGHDAAVMARVVPSALLFVRTPDGLSHHPDERVAEEDVAAALRALGEVARDPRGGERG